MLLLDAEMQTVAAGLVDAVLLQDTGTAAAVADAKDGAVEGEDGVAACLALGGSLHQFVVMAVGGYLLGGEVEGGEGEGAVVVCLVVGYGIYLKRLALL